MKIKYALPIFFLLASNKLFSQDTAKVDSRSGVYIFYKAKPLRPYEIVATMHSKCLACDMVNQALAKYAEAAKDKYIDCDAIILNDFSLGFRKDDIEVIRWKH